MFHALAIPRAGACAQPCERRRNVSDLAAPSMSLAASAKHARFWKMRPVRRTMRGGRIVARLNPRRRPLPTNGLRITRRLWSERLDALEAFAAAERRRHRSRHEEKRSNADDKGFRHRARPRRFQAAPPKRVFDAGSIPSDRAMDFGRDCATKRACHIKIDPRVGGSFSSSWRQARGHHHVGTYREIERPRRLFHGASPSADESLSRSTSLRAASGARSPHPSYGCEMGRLGRSYACQWTTMLKTLDAVFNENRAVRARRRSC